MDDTWTDEGIDGELREDDRARVKSEIDPTERLLWLGRPMARPAPLGRGFSAFAAVAAVAWVVAIGCAVTTGRRGWGHGDAAGLGVFALAVAGIDSTGLSLYLLNRRSTRARLGRTLYALTDRRAIIWTPSGRPGGVAVHSISRSAVTKVHRVEYPDGSGDVVFRQPTDMESIGTPSGFEMVPEVVRVERLVRESLLGDGT